MILARFVSVNNFVTNRFLFGSNEFVSAFDNQCLFGSNKFDYDLKNPYKFILDIIIAKIFELK